MIIEEHYCTKCGAILDEQDGYDPEVGYWTCTECGQFLTDPDDAVEGARFEDVSWFCDGCGAYLNRQEGFSDWCDTWICTECGYSNSISEDEIKAEPEDDSENEIEDGSDDTFAESLAKGIIEGAVEGIADGLLDSLFNRGGSEDDMIEEAESDEDMEASEYDESQVRDFFMNNETILQINEKNMIRAELRQAKKYRKKAGLKRLWSAIAHGKMISVKLTPEMCIGQNYGKVFSKFEKNGFSNVCLNEIEDLEFEEISNENIVTEVTIDGNDYFEIATHAKYDADVVITYHKLKKVEPPMSYKEARKQSGKLVINAFEGAGFVNVREKIIDDLVLGLMKKDGKVDSVTIAGDAKYKAGKRYRIDVPIVVTYHTFR